jgi:hypothetical protein
MATREELEAILSKASPDAAETALLRAEAAQLRGNWTQKIARLKVLRLKNGFTPAERDEVDTIRRTIGPDVKFAARMSRKVGDAVESVR